MLVGIGSAEHDAVLEATGMIGADEIDAIKRLGGSGELLGHYFDAKGVPVETRVLRRILTLPLDRLKGRRIVAISGGTTKVDAMRAVLATGLLTGLITDERTARAIVDAGPTTPRLTD